MYNLYVDEKIGDFTQISSGGFKSNCVEQDKDLLKQFIIIKEYLLLKHIEQKSEKERKEKKDVLDVLEEVHDVLQVSEEKVSHPRTRRRKRPEAVVTQLNTITMNIHET